MDTGLISPFDYYEQCCYIHGCACICLIPCLHFFFDIYSKVELLDHRIIVHLILGETFRFFHICCTLLCSHCHGLNSKAAFHLVMNVPGFISPNFNIRRTMETLSRILRSNYDIYLAGAAEVVWLTLIQWLVKVKGMNKWTLDNLVQPLVHL